MLYAIVGMLVIILDQGVKYWVTNNIMLNTVTEPLIPGVLSLVRMHNDGAAFSFLSGGGARIYFVILTGVFTVAVILALATNFINGKFGRWCLVIVTAAGLSNCLDRILYGFVVDMFKIDMFNFAVFNVADIFITVFSLLFIFYIIFGGNKEKDSLKDEFDEYDDEEADSRSFAGDFRDTVDSVKGKKRAGKPRFDDFEEEKPDRKSRSNAFEEEKPRKTDRYTTAPEEPGENSLRPMRKPKVLAPEAKKTAAEKKEELRPTPTAERRYTAPARRPVEEDDPFAEWERANVRAENYYAQSPAAKAMGAAPSKNTQSAGAERLYMKASADKAADEKPSVEKSTAAPARPTRTERPAPKPAKSEDEFNLDDILAEFK